MLSALEVLAPVLPNSRSHCEYAVWKCSSMCRTITRLASQHVVPVRVLVVLVALSLLEVPLPRAESFPPSQLRAGAMHTETGKRW